MVSLAPFQHLLRVRVVGVWLNRVQTRVARAPVKPGILGVPPQVPVGQLEMGKPSGDVPI